MRCTFVAWHGAIADGERVTVFAEVPRVSAAISLLTGSGVIRAASSFMFPVTAEILIDVPHSKQSTAAATARPNMPRADGYLCVLTVRDTVTTRTAIEPATTSTLLARGARR
jgi:hypothetical protein